MRHHFSIGSSLLACACTLFFPAAAQEVRSFPQRTVTIVVPFPAGGTADILPRVIGEKLAQKWGHSVVVENRTGAGGNIGADAVARAKPDGHTLLATPPGPLVVNQSLYKNLPYDPLEFVPITTIASAPNVLAVRKDFPAATAQEFIDYVRAHPGEVLVATQGNGATSHLTGAMFSGAVGSPVVFVPYRGTAPALADLLGGQVDTFFDNIGSMYPQHQNGLARILAVASRERSALLPGVPTLAESGLPDFHSATWFGMVAPPGTPPEVAAQIQAAVAEVLQMPDIRERFEKQGVTPVGESPAEFATFMDEERRRWGAVIDAHDVALN